MSEETETKTKNIIEALLDQMNNVREILPIYDSIPTGKFAAAWIREDLNEAEQALSSGDVVRMVRAYSRLIEVKA